MYVCPSVIYFFSFTLRDNWIQNPNWQYATMATFIVLYMGKTFAYLNNNRGAQSAFKVKPGT